MSEPAPSLSDLRIDRSRFDHPSGGGRRWLFAGLALVAVALLVAFLLRPRPVPVTVAAVSAGEASAEPAAVLHASGYVTARRQATVSSKLTGRVSEVLVEEGMKVREGQVLARLDDTNVRTSLHLAEAQLAAATNALAETRVRIKEAAQELQRQTDLIKNQIATQANYDHAEAAHLALQARLEQQQAEIAVAAKQVAYWQQQLDDTVIRAPFSGIVTSKNAQPGEMISPISAGGGFTRTGICTIVDMESLEIEIDVNESYINRVHPGQAVEAALDAYRDWKIPSKVIAIIPTADRQKSTVKVRVGMDQLDPRILPEMSVKVAFREVGGTGPLAGRTVTIPQAAVRQQDGRSVVWVVSAGRAERRAVTVSNTHQGETVVSAGLSAGERVIVEGPPDLKEGLAVAEKEAARQ